LEDRDAFCLLITTCEPNTSNHAADCAAAHF
jgi:hypothetical protein